MRKQWRVSVRGNRAADQRLCFCYWIVQFLYFLTPKFQSSGHFLRLYSPVSVAPGRKSGIQVFSRRGSIHFSGADGAKGVQGEKGDSGSQGSAGPTGAKGTKHINTDLKKI